MSNIENSQIEGLLNDIITQQTLITDFFSSSKVKFTIEGGYAVKLTNKTGGVSIKGTLVETHTTIDNAFQTAGADGIENIGVVYENGIADGEECWVVVGGIAEVLLEDSTLSTRGYWARSSTTVAGRVDITNADPPGLVLSHFAEIGHCIESKSSGTDVLAKIVLHFN